MSNAWSQFRGLLPENPTIVALVVEHNADGTSTVEQPSGDRFRAIGQGVAEGSMAFVRAGAVIAEAPDVASVVDLEV